VDGDTASACTVTVRHRDTMTQDRVALDAVAGYLAERLA
jgi:glycyl-tRNA synthetase